MTHTIETVPHEHRWLEITTIGQAARFEQHYICRCGDSRTVIEETGRVSPACPPTTSPPDGGTRK